MNKGHNVASASSQELPYFTPEHFELLRVWREKEKTAGSGPVQHAYDALYRAYTVTEAWADGVQRELFPDGYVSVRKRPTNQGNHFTSYNWARIYPTKGSPKKLAYTVGIDAEHGFVVKIDTVGLSNNDPARISYLQLRGPGYQGSPIGAVLPERDGLALGLDELVAWSLDAIRGFAFSYAEVASTIGADQALSDEDILRRFDSKLAFRTFRASWSPEESALFAGLARSVHAAGLDWWHIGQGIQVRFGRKEPGGGKAHRVLGLVQGNTRRTINVSSLGSFKPRTRATVDAALVSQIEAALKTQPDEVRDLAANRPGLWPDEMEEDVEDAGDRDGRIPEQEDALQQDGRPAINRIYYGPPGTGKTWTLRQLLEREYERGAAVVSGDAWRNHFVEQEIAQLTWWEGVAAALHEAGGKADVTTLLAHPFVRAIAETKGRTQHLRQTVWGTLQTHAVEKSETVRTKQRLSPLIFDKDSASVWRLSGEWPDAGDNLIELVRQYREGGSSSEKVKRHSFVTFHQSYGYEEFVEGLRPVLAGPETSEVQYEIRPGVFKELCRRARTQPNQRFAMVIDEINRGNISKVLGELITLIEVDKREGASQEISAILPYSGEPFSVPANVDIIGTMNTADRSLAALDTALRRRFEFVPIFPDSRDDEGAPLHGLRVKAGEVLIHVPNMLAAMNERIEALYDRDHSIGHAYFESLKYVRNEEEGLPVLAQIFRNRIIPLLEEYFFEDWEKIRLVLADNQKPEGSCFVVPVDAAHDRLDRLFGSGHGLKSTSLRPAFKIDVAAFNKPEAYVGIYHGMVD